MERLHALAALGVHLYIDDFGTGYSSLSYLQMLPVDGLKLAQEFVESLPGTETESGLVRTIRDLADTLGLSAVVAEGIERPEQWDSLLSLGYSVGQGFHLAVPMPAEPGAGVPLRRRPPRRRRLGAVARRDRAGQRRAETAARRVGPPAPGRRRRQRRRPASGGVASARPGRARPAASSGRSILR